MINITQESAFAAKYHAEQISDKLLLVGYSHDEGDIKFWLADAEARLVNLNALLGFKIERVDAQVAVSVWQPIATAPRDGRVVWLWNKRCADKADAPQRFWWSTHYSIFGHGGCWTDGLCTMGDKIDFDFWCHDLPENFIDPYASVSEPDVADQAEVA